MCYDDEKRKRKINCHVKIRNDDNSTRKVGPILVQAPSA